MGHGLPGPPGESGLDMYKVNHSTTVMYTWTCIENILTWVYVHKCVIYNIHTCVVRVKMSVSYRIPGIFRGMYFSRLSMKQGFSQLKFCGWRLSKIFHIFRTLLQGYVRKIYATNLIEIDKTLYQIAYHSRGNPRPPCGKSWESVLSPVGQSKCTDNITIIIKK